MNQTTKSGFAVGLVAALLAGLGAGAGAASAQEDEGDVRERISISMSGGGGYLGVNIADVDEGQASDLGMARAYGVFINDVVSRGPAEEAGLEAGDVIVRWNGERLESVAQLQRLARETPPGREVQLSVLRDGAEREVSLELGSRRSVAPRIVSGGRVRTPSDFGRDLDWVSPTIEIRRNLENLVFRGRGRLGVNVQSLGEQLADYFGVEEGVLVTSVLEDTPAAAGGLRAGDVIVGIGDEDIDSPSDLTRAVAEAVDEAMADADEVEVSVDIVRDGSGLTLTVELEAREGPFRWRRGNSESARR